MDIEIDDSLAESDLEHTEELSLTMLCLEHLSVLSHFNIKVKSLGNMALLILQTD